MGKAIDKLKNIKIVRVLKNIWSVEDLRQRIFTFSFLLRCLPEGCD